MLRGLIDAHSHAVIAGLAALSRNLEDTEVDIDSLKKKAQHRVREGDYNSETPWRFSGLTQAQADVLPATINSNYTIIGRV